MRLLAATLAAASLAVSPALIVPGKSIGPVSLGASPAEVAAASEANCPIRAIFKDAQAVQLFTNCGGAWATHGGTQVGLPLLWAVREFGHPDSIAAGATYRWPSGREARAVWYLYRGIAFRAVVPGGEPDEAGVVTCIAVYNSARPILSEGCGQ